MDVIEKDLCGGKSEVQVAAANRAPASFIATGIRLEARQ